MTHEGIKSAIRATYAVHQLTVDRVTYDCSLTHTLEMLIQNDPTLQAFAHSAAQSAVNTNAAKMDSSRALNSQPSPIINPSTISSNRFVAAFPRKMSPMPYEKAVTAREQPSLSLVSFDMDSFSPRSSRVSSVCYPSSNRGSILSVASTDSFLDRSRRSSVSSTSYRKSSLSSRGSSFYAPSETFSEFASNDDFDEIQPSQQLPFFAQGYQSGIPQTVFQSATLIPHTTSLNTFSQAGQLFLPADDVNVTIQEQNIHNSICNDLFTD
jgi:hypothetical protein